jgi:hypothetical protein
MEPASIWFSTQLRFGLLQSKGGQVFAFTFSFYPILKSKPPV